MQSIFTLDDEDLEFTEEEFSSSFGCQLPGKEKENSFRNPPGPPLENLARNTVNNPSAKRSFKFKSPNSMKLKPCSGTDFENGKEDTNLLPFSRTVRPVVDQGLSCNNVKTAVGTMRVDDITSTPCISIGVRASHSELKCNIKTHGQPSSTSMQRKDDDTVQRGLNSECTDLADVETDKKSSQKRCSVSPLKNKVKVPMQPTSQKAKRKFPGPAGALPHISHVRQLQSPEAEHLNGHTPGRQHGKISKGKNHLDLLSTSDPDDFKRDFWLKLQRDAIEACRGLCYHSIAMVHRKATQYQLTRGKVPLMCALIKSFSMNSTDASVILRDPTGEIKGTVHQQVLEKNQSELVSGGGIALKQVSVFSPTTKRHYVNITPSNILFLINPQITGENFSQSSQVCSQDERTSFSKHEMESKEQRIEGTKFVKSSETILSMDRVGNPTTEALVEDDLDEILCELEDDEDILIGLT